MILDYQPTLFLRTDSIIFRTTAYSQKNIIISRYSSIVFNSAFKAVLSRLHSAGQIVLLKNEDFIYHYSEEIERSMK
ncbi:hypothetical protein RB195_026185 [Necator americanus]|uniref:Uncharacterized protein n=1 Tax=Necator americanus TaxID=51031 RepID=A0ABR1EW12_NECAM